MDRFVISITTLPARLPNIRPILNSILQICSMDILYLCLPDGLPEDHPDILNLPLNHSKFRLIRCYDYGPITKIVGVLDYEQEPETLILTLDDDIIIEDDIVKIFRNKANMYPKSALSMSGWCYGAFPFRYQIVIDNIHDVKVDWLQGVHGILYRRYFINKEDLLKYKGDDKMLFKNDDHRISAYLQNCAIDRIAINLNPKYYMKNYIASSSIESISGSSFGESLKFWWNVMTISQKFNYESIYKLHYGCNRSILVIPILILSLIVIYLIMLSLYGHNLYYLLIFTIIAIFIIVIVFKDFNDCFLDKA